MADTRYPVGEARLRRWEMYGLRAEHNREDCELGVPRQSHGETEQIIMSIWCNDMEIMWCIRVVAGYMVRSPTPPHQ